jgi:hypothetical protein
LHWLPRFLVAVGHVQITPHFGWLTSISCICKSRFVTLRRKVHEALREGHEQRWSLCETDGNLPPNQFLSIEEARCKIKGRRDGNNDHRRRDVGVG